MVEYLQSIINWIYSGVYDFFVQFISYLISMLTIFYLKSAIIILDFSWKVASDILRDLHFSKFIASIYSNFDNKIIDLILWLRIPDFVSAISTGYVTRYVLRFIPFA